MTDLNDILAHHGIKGMKWGVRRASSNSEEKAKGHVGKSAKKVEIKTRKVGGKTVVTAKGGSGHAPTSDAIKTKAINQKLKKSGIDSLSNDELAHLTRRMNLETQVKSLNDKNQSEAQKFVKDTIKRIAAQKAAEFASNPDNIRKVAKVLQGTA